MGIGAKPKAPRQTSTLFDESAIGVEAPGAAKVSPIGSLVMS